MKTLTAALLATAFIGGPAFACPGMSAQMDYMKPAKTATVIAPKTEEAMSTFDPHSTPVFEEAIEASEEESTPELKKPLVVE